jgi:hypothetical protein
MEGLAFETVPNRAQVVVGEQVCQAKGHTERKGERNA